ncbi:MAG: hypothetical protein JO136_22465 [Hyphomicrobiales bacterium]|nr:hypothetical protein [Hyphomicrobiales bacterium]MBV9910554.1 hypothetical protein [Hyphomicrobiales bacterium]
MSNKIDQIQIELRKPVATMREAAERARTLKELFNSLGQNEAVGMGNVLLTLEQGGKKLEAPLNFRRLSRALRLDLMLILVSKIGTQSTAELRKFITDATHPFHLGLLFMFPASEFSQRQTLVQSLTVGVPSGVPTITLEFRNAGSFSVDNEAPLLKDPKKRPPNKLGVLDSSVTNQMEIRGNLRGHRPDAEYSADRVIESKTFERTAGKWQIREHLPAWTDDNTHQGDEDTHADHDHIFVMDAPGFPRPISTLSSAVSSDTTELVQMMNAVEQFSVRIGTGGAMQEMDSLNWLSIVWAEKINGQWRRKPNWNMIRTGQITNLSMINSPEDANL